MNAFLLIFGAVVLAVGVAAGRYFAGGKGWKWVNTTDDKDRYDEKAVLRFCRSVCTLWAAVSAAAPG